MKVIRELKRLKSYLTKGGEFYVINNQIKSEKLLEGKTILVTGGNSGIGYAIAKTCAFYGAKLIITGRNQKKLELVSKELNCDYISWDISHIDEIDKKIEEIKKVTNSKLDCFVNCAGIYKDIRYTSCSEDDFDQIINTNLKGPYFAINKVITEIFEKNGQGNVVIIASNRGIFGDDGPYGISKAGLINYGRGLANKVLNKNIRVNIINPGMTASNINGIEDTDNLYDDYLKGKRVITANEIANIVVFLSSDSSRCMTGQVINCDNGESNL